MGANPNTMTFKTVYLAEYAMSHYKQPVYQVLADTRFESDLVKGQVLSRSYASDVVVNDMGADGSYATQAITDTAETLTINKEKEASIYIKSLDLLQAHLSVKQKYARKLANALINQIDADVLGAAFAAAGSTVDNSDFGGTAGDGIVVSATNVAQIFTTAMQKLRLQNVIYNANARFSGMKLEQPEGMPIAIITPEVLTFVELYLGGKDTLLGDNVSKNGYQGYFMGFELFLSNALPWTGVLSVPVIPVAGEAFVINGVSFQAAADGAATNPGDFSIQTTNDLAMAELVKAINGTGTPGADAYIDVSTANRAKLKNITASYDTATDKLTVTSYGKGTVVVSTTSVGSSWTAATQKVHCIFGLSKSLSLVVQKNPSLEENFVSSKIGRDYIAWTVYGMKVFIDQVPQLVKVSIQSSTFSSADQTPN